MGEYEIRDPIYGFITFDEWEREIISHPWFQRLRRIRQLGLTDMVYPGAMHTRFEHSLGVMHLVTKMFDSIMKNEENRKLLEDYFQYSGEDLNRYRKIVRLAGLLHDVGHAPYSHVSEQIMPKNTNTKKPFKHEDYTKAIIEGPMKRVIEANNHTKHFDISTKDITNIISGNPETPVGLLFWRVIISSQLDADRCDYLLRDSHHTGVKYGIYDLERLLNTLKLGVNPESNELVLGIKKGGWHVAESLIIARYQMFTQMYFHKTRRAYDYMIQQALKESIGLLPPPSLIEDFLELDDYSVWHCMRIKGSEWFTNLISRKHIRLLYETKEMPIESEEKMICRLKECLNHDNIWVWEDSQGIRKNWYSGGDDKEVHIIDKFNNSMPLSYYSTIVKNMYTPFMKIRLYVKYKDVKNAIKIKEGLT